MAVCASPQVLAVAKKYGAPRWVEGTQTKAEEMKGGARREEENKPMNAAARIWVREEVVSTAVASEKDVEVAKAAVEVRDNEGAV